MRFKLFSASKFISDKISRILIQNYLKLSSMRNPKQDLELRPKAAEAVIFQSDPLHILNNFEYMH